MKVTCNETCSVGTTLPSPTLDSLSVSFELDSLKPLCEMICIHWVGGTFCNVNESLRISLLMTNVIPEPVTLDGKMLGSD